MNPELPTDRYPLIADAAGTYDAVNSDVYDEVDVILLRGGVTSHHGVTIGKACRIVNDPAGAFNLSAIGWVFPVSAKDARQAMKQRPDARYVLLVLPEDRKHWPDMSTLWNASVRIEWAA